MALILVLEDDPAVQQVLQAVLRRKGFDFVVAATADDALALYNQHRGAVSLSIADVHLPLRSGTDAAVQLRQLDPRLPILFTSGTPMEFWNETDHRNIAEFPQDSFGFLPKPFTCWELVQKIGELLPAFRLARTA